MSTASFFGVSCEKWLKNKTTHKLLVGRWQNLCAYFRYYGDSIDPHIGVQMLSAHRQAMCKVELDISVKVQERFAGRQAGFNLIGLWDEFDLLMVPI